MPTTLTAPRCLHIPPLCWNKPATVSWERTLPAGTDGYELEAIFDGEFDAFAGSAWQDVESQARTWERVEAAGRTWADSVNPDAVYAAYRGPGTPAAGGSFEQDREHTCHFVSVPADVQTARFRVRAYSGSDSSAFYLSDLAPVKEKLVVTDDLLRLPVTAGRKYFLQIDGRTIPDFDETLTLTYPHALVSLEHIFLDTFGAKTDLATFTPPAAIQVVAGAPGELRFRLLKAMAEGTAWTGLVLCICLRALGTGDAEIQLSE